MKKEIVSRTIDEANFIIETEKIIRELTDIFTVIKSTIHKDLSERLTKIDIELFNKVNKVLQKHLNIRHIKGGEATRKKYKKLK